jgi:hypothetical protein
MTKMSDTWTQKETTVASESLVEEATIVKLNRDGYSNTER